MAKRPRDEEGEGLLGSLRRIVQNIIFPSFDGPAAPAAPTAPPLAAAAAPESGSPPAPQRSTKRRKVETHLSEDEEEPPSSREADLSQMTLADLKREGYTIDEIARIYENEPPPRFSQVGPAAIPSRSIGSGATPLDRQRPILLSQKGNSSAGPRRPSAPVGSYSPSLALPLYPPAPPSASLR